MKKKVFKNVWLRVAMIVAVVTTAFAGTAWADDVLYKTMDFTGAEFSGPAPDYTSDWTATYNNFKVSLSKFKNTKDNSGNHPYSYVECNGAAEITTAIAIDKPISKIEVTTRSIANTVSLTLQTSANYVNWTEVGTFSTVDGKQSISFANTTAKLYYRIKFTGGNAQVTQIEYYKFVDPTVVQAPEFVDGEAKFTGSTTVKLESPTEGATIKYSTNGVDWSDYAEAGITLVETTTVKAQAFKDGMTASAVVSKSFCNAADVESATWNLRVEPTGQNETTGATWTDDTNHNPTHAVMSYSAQVSPTTYGGTTFANGETLQFKALTGYQIVSITITAAESKNIVGYTTGWDNATAEANGAVLTVTPEDGTLLVSVRIDVSGKNPPTPSALSVEVECAPVATYITTTISSVGFSTLYYQNLNLEVPADVTAYTYNVTNNKLTKGVPYATGAVIPAGEAVVLEGTAGNHDFKVTKTTTATKDENNALRGFDEANTTVGDDAEVEYYFYALMRGKNGGPVGFYWMTTDGSAFTSAANKAYLALPKSMFDESDEEVTVKGFAFGEDDATAIQTIESAVEDGAIYNVAGQRLQKMQKGINIVNGKKILK